MLIETYFNCSTGIRIHVVSSTVTFGLVCWGGNLLRQDRERIDLIKTAVEVAGKNQKIS